MRESTSLLYPFKSLTKYKNWAYMSSHMGHTSPRETTITYYMMLHWGLFPRLTIKVVPQGLETIQTSRKGVTHIPNGGTTTYNDNIHHNIFRSYKYINTVGFKGKCILPKKQPIHHQLEFQERMFQRKENKLPEIYKGV